MEPINVLRVITRMPPGGIERRLVAVLPRLDSAKFKPRLVCLHERGPLADQLEDAGVPVDLIPFRKRWDVAALRRLAAYMRRHHIHIVHSHMYRANVPATVASHMAGIGRVWGQVHNMHTWETRRQLWMDRRLCRWRAGMIAVSEQVRREVTERLGLSADRVRLIYNGIETDRFVRAYQQRETLRKQHHLAQEHTVFIFSGRLVEQKRCRDFLEAFGRLQAMQDGENLRAWVLGSGRLEHDLRRQAAALPNPTAVQFLGRRDEVEHFLAAADVFVLPSLREGFSNALVEAMAANLGIVATDVGGNAEAIRHRCDGLIVPPLDRDRLGRAMEEMWRRPDLRKLLADSAARRARLFSLDRMVENIERLYLESVGWD